MKSTRGMALSKAIGLLALALFILWILLGLLFPTVGHGPSSAPKAQAKNDVVQLATAAIAFETEYGRLPGTGRQIVDADLLAILTGRNAAINPRNIVFIEVSPYKKGKGGLSNGTFLDPWGAPCHIAFADGTNSSVQAGANAIAVKKRVAVWNDPAQGPPPSWWQQEASVKHERARRYVTSWE